MKPAAFVLLFLALSDPAAAQTPAAQTPIAGTGTSVGSGAATEDRPCLLGSGGGAPAWPTASESAQPRRSRGRAGWEREPRHRIEARFGVWRSPRFSHGESQRDIETSSADFAFGVEYLRLVAYDVAIGVGAQTRVRGTEQRFDRDNSYTTGGTTVMVPFVARWNPLRRLTRWRTLEPYVTGGFGPVIRADWETREIDNDQNSSTESRPPSAPARA